MILSRFRTSPSYYEFVLLVSMMMSLTGLSIDTMLPALAQISNDLHAASANDRQLVVALIFLGLAFGQLFFGPLSDSTGRKTAIYSGLILFVLGSLISMLAFSLPVLLFGRLLQGFGLSAPRAVTLALVRDQYDGRAMARVMSLAMTVFILVPIVAPSIGQVILHFSGWRTIFGSFILLAMLISVWFGLRMPETLAPENRVSLSWRRIGMTAVQIIRIRPAIGYTITAGLIGGAFIGYLSSSQQILQEQYALGARFPLYFAILASAVGLASLLNARLVVHLGMRLLVKSALLTILLLSMIALVVAWWTAGTPSLGVLTGYLLLTFFCIGILFGNMNSLAMEPLGHIAGIGAAIVGSLSTLISFVLGTLIGQSYNGSIVPLVLGLGVLGAVSLAVVTWVDDR